MSIFRKLINKLFGIRNKDMTSPSLKVGEWYTVEWDDNKIYRKARPPGRDAWEDYLCWADIIRVCFKANDFAASDGILIFTSLRPESYAIPIEATGGQELWNEIIKRHLFDPELAIKAATATSGLFCWPNDNTAT